MDNQGKKNVSFLLRSVQAMPFEALFSFIQRNGMHVTLTGYGGGKGHWRGVVWMEGTVKYSATDNSPKYALAAAITCFLLAETKDIHAYMSTDDPGH